MSEGRTYTTPTSLVLLQTFSSLLASFRALRKSTGPLFVLLKVLSPPRLGDPAAIVEELPDNHHIVAKDTLGHPHPVHSDVWAKSFYRLSVSLWTALS